MAWIPPGRGELKERVRIERRSAPIDDGYGNVQGGWETFVPSRRVRLLPTRGGEAVQADRLQGISAWVLDVPADSLVRLVTDDMRVVDDRDASRIWAVRSVLDLEGRDRWRTLTLEMGGADA
jgi:hypothetical protein